MTVELIGYQLLNVQYTALKKDPDIYVDAN